MMHSINHAPWGGWIVLPVVEGKMGYILGTVLGALTTALIVNLLKKPVTVPYPAARKPGTPVSGMPILDVDKAQNVVVMKRGRGTGYAGIQNELYFEDNTQMLFGDAKASLQAVIAAVKELIN